MEHFLSRKFIGFVIVAIMLFTLVLFNFIDGQTFVTFITANLGVYTAGNAVEHVTESMKK